jgi:excisionase family DNA binding protein
VIKSQRQNGNSAGRCESSGAGDIAFPPQIVRHLALALMRHVQHLRKNGLHVPPEIDELAAFLTHCVRVRPQTTRVADDLEAPHHGRVAGRLLVTKAEAAERLGVSVRTVERLVAAGRLPLVHVEHAARLRVSDLEAFVNNLAEDQAPQQDSRESQ